eukprot:scaffold91333_cov23-Tisochrysis_lutea.AAC.5
MSDFRLWRQRPACAYTAPERLSVAHSASRSRRSASFSRCATALARLRAALSAGDSLASISPVVGSCGGVGISGLLSTEPAPKRNCCASSRQPPPLTMARSPPRSTQRASERQAMARTVIGSFSWESASR